LENSAAMTVSEHGGATAMVQWCCAVECLGTGERRAGRKSELEQAAEARGLLSALPQPARPTPMYGHHAVRLACPGRPPTAS